MTDTKTTTASVTVTVDINGIAKTFTASATTEGDPGNAARGLITALRTDAADWTFDVEKEAR